jgi:hypothetical protein
MHKFIIACLFLGFTSESCSESDGGSTSNVLMLMLYWSEKMRRNSMYLAPNTRLIHKTSNRLTLITVFCFRVDPPSHLWRHMKPKNWLLYKVLRSAYISEIHICPLLAWYEIILPAYIHTFTWLCHYISRYTIFFGDAYNFFLII